MRYLFAFFLRSDNLWICAALGACGGLYLFYRGFRILQRKRLIVNTPTSKIRSAALGLVESTAWQRDLTPFQRPLPEGRATTTELWRGSCGNRARTKNGSRWQTRACTFPFTWTTTPGYN